jgi:hypothetical protein
MKNIYLILISLFITATAASAQDSWVTHKGDNRISLKFPVEPKELTPGSFIAVSKDSSVFIFTIVDFQVVANLDSAALAPMKTSPEFAEQLKTGLNQSLPDVAFPDFVIGSWKGFTSYTSTGVDTKKKKYDMFMFIIGSKLYSVSTVSNDGVSNQGHNDFVNSLVLSN